MAINQEHCLPTALEQENCSFNIVSLKTKIQTKKFTGQE